MLLKPVQQHAATINCDHFTFSYYYGNTIGLYPTRKNPWFFTWSLVLLPRCHKIWPGTAQGNGGGIWEMGGDSVSGYGELVKSLRSSNVAIENPLHIH